MGIGGFQGATISDQGVVSGIRVPYRTRNMEYGPIWSLLGPYSLSVSYCTKRVKRCIPLYWGMPKYPGHGL